MAEFVNPYNFVRSEYDRTKTDPPLQHDRIHVDHYSGRLSCTLTTVSRVATKSFDEGRKDRIYGSSLKGMIRSVAEALALACFPLGKKACPKCRQADRLCICCRIFGWLDGGNVHQGRVHISDAEPSNTGWCEMGYLRQHALASPKPQHSPFYDAGGQPRGRKFYYHHDPSHTNPEITTQSHGSSGETLHMAKAQRVFSFSVDFADLKGSELGLLLYALQLEDGWFHKFGKAKPLGLGTVKIAISTVALLPPNRYEVWDTHPTPLESLPLSTVGMSQSLTSTTGVDADTIWNDLSVEERRIKFVETRVEEFFQHQFGVSHQQAATLPHWRDLDHLLRQHNSYSIRYPSQNWFQKNSSVKLPTAEEVKGNPPGDRSKWLKE